MRLVTFAPCTVCDYSPSLLMRFSESPVVQLCQGCIEDALGQMELEGSRQVHEAFRPPMNLNAAYGKYPVQQDVQQDSVVMKTCGCGKTYTLDAWLKLPLAGDFKDEEDFLEMRTCSCRSTISLAVLYETHDARWYEQEEEKSHE